MAVPLRKASGYTQAIPQPTRRQPTPQGATQKRLVSRQVQSNASYRNAVVWVFLGISTVLLLMLFSYTFVRAGVSRLNYEMNTLKRENAEIVLESERIRGQIAELRSLDRIEEIASRELGMIKNTEVEYMLLSSTTVAEGKIKAAQEAAEAEMAVEDSAQARWISVISSLWARLLGQ